MARKDLLKGLIEGAADDAVPSPAPRMTRGAIGAVSRSIADLKGRAMVDVPADLIDDAGLPDRLDTDEDGIAALAESIRTYGQQVPVMLRHSPNYEGRYEVVYGRRRVAALRRLGVPVRAMVRELSDHDLIVAQGQENAARKDLSFIEKALFANSMSDQGFARSVICDALHIDKTVVSRMLSVVDAVPEALIRAIGAAPAAGRDRWLSLAERVRGKDIDTLVATAKGPDSDARFRAVFDLAARSRPLRGERRPLLGAGGAEIGQMRRNKTHVAIEIARSDADFADWLVTRMEELHRDWKQQARGKN